MLELIKLRSWNSFVQIATRASSFGRQHKLSERKLENLEKLANPFLLKSVHRGKNFTNYNKAAAATQLAPQAPPHKHEGNGINRKN